MRQHAPLDVAPDHVAQGVEHVMRRMATLTRRFRHQFEVRGNHCPFFVTDVGRVGVSSIHADPATNPPESFCSGYS